jgi:hypothetical protein
MMRSVEEVPLVDTGRATEICVSGLGRVYPIDGGWAEFGFYREVREGGERIRLINVKLIGPIAAVAPAFDLCVMELGSGILVPVRNPALRRLLV